MKLLTNIIPRKDGTIILEAGGRKYVFKPDDSGALVCDIDDSALVGRLLAMDDMYEPADDADFDDAERLVGAARAASAEAAAAAQKPVKGIQVQEDGSGDFNEIMDGGLPQEANTPPVKSTLKTAKVHHRAAPAA